MGSLYFILNTYVKKLESKKVLCMVMELVELYKSFRQVKNCPITKTRKNVWLSRNQFI